MKVITFIESFHMIVNELQSTIRDERDTDTSITYNIII